jgi:S-adenosylmethionine:tRNA ribosyltransferase-isomerase
VRVSEFSYDLPGNLIAAEPLPDRAASRLLHVERNSGQVRDLQFRDFPDLLRQDDLLVFNNSKVFPARLYGTRGGRKAQPLSPRNPASRDFLQGQVEVLLTKQISPQPPDWECLVRPGKRIGVGEQLFFGPGAELRAEVTARGSFGERRLRFQPVEDFLGLVQKIGHVPLPPYIKRPDRPEDRERYQTVYARELGSVAAPTAGLHFTPEILTRIRERGIEVADITLHVGLGTFQPVRATRVEDHQLHTETYWISQDAAQKINRAFAACRRIVAIGTTTVRTIEHAARGSGVIKPGNNEADIFIYPGHQFQMVAALLTNFHLPRSTLLMLVSAFAGNEIVLAAYRHAVQQKYRFYSYGDCMLIE